MNIPSHGLSIDDLNMLQDALAPFADEIEAVGLFGSRATGRYRPNSDIDLVLFGPVREATADRIYTILNDCAFGVTVDVQAYDLIAYPPLKAHTDEVMVPLFGAQQPKPAHA
jgi:uncharacterized protein